MKNIVFYSISLSLVGLLRCHDQANDDFALHIFGSGEIENLSSFTVIDDFGSELSPSSNYFKMLGFMLWNETIVVLNKLYDSFLISNAIKISDKNTAKRVTRNANAADGPLARTNITEQPQIISSVTESVMANRLVENRTQPHIDLSTVTNSTPSADLPSETFLAVKRLTVDITKQNTNDNESEVSKILNRFSIWVGDLNTKKNMDIVTIIIVSSALLLLFLSIMLSVAYRAHQSRNSRSELHQQLVEVVL